MKNHAENLFPVERLFADTDLLMRTVSHLPHHTAKEKSAALLLAAATVAVKGHHSKRDFLRGVELAWKIATGTGTGTGKENK
jgi:hypothetical protein